LTFWTTHPIILNCVMVMGFYLQMNSKALSQMIFHLRVLLPLMLFCIPLFGMTFPDQTITFDYKSARNPLSLMLYEFGGLLWVAVVATFARIFCNEPFHKGIFDFLNNSVYTVYLVHNLPIYALGMLWKMTPYWSGKDGPHLLSWIVLQSGTLCCCFLLHILFSRSRVTRFMFAINASSTRAVVNQKAMTSV